jgi:hypothetical protein
MIAEFMIDASILGCSRSSARTRASRRRRSPLGEGRVLLEAQATGQERVADEPEGEVVAAVEVEAAEAGAGSPVISEIPERRDARFLRLS